MQWAVVFMHGPTIRRATVQAESLEELGARLAERNVLAWQVVRIERVAEGC